MHVIGTAGHVDHGKSSLVKRLTGIDPDRLAEEKQRGLTIDLGFAWMTLPSGREAGIVDVPGHERFIKNMLAGAGGISVCLFVVAANEGWMPQSAEHLAALHMLGITAGVVAVTKADTVDAETLEIALEEVEEHLAPSSLQHAPVIPCSAVTGMGLDELVGALDDVVASIPPPPDLGRPRLWADRVFTIAGAGTVVTGTLTGGALATGDEVELLGGTAGANRLRRARIRSIQSHKREVDRIEPGNRTALNLAGLERTASARGDAIVRSGWWHVTARAHAHITVLPPEISGREHELKEKDAHLLHVGSAETPVRIKLLGRKRLGPGESGYARLDLRAPLPLMRGDRFVLRDAGRVLTFGGGKILDPLPGPEYRQDGDRIRLLERIEGVSSEDALRALVEEAGSIYRKNALFRTGLTLLPEGVVSLSDTLVSRKRYEELSRFVLTTLTEYHGAHPLERGITRERLRAAMGLDGPTFDALIAGLPGIIEDGVIVRLASHRVAFSSEQQAARDKLLHSLQADDFSPPPPAELDADPALIRSLIDGGEIVRIGDFLFSAAQAQAARGKVRALIEEMGPVTVAQIRDVLRTSRKYAVPLCEWLDQTGATVRRGDIRLLGPNP
jgi:selenocysteine-specific elongation factor